MTPHPLTVLHVNTERGWRGGERQTLWLAEGLALAGHRCMLAARPEQPLACRAAAAGITVVPCAPTLELDVISGLTLRRSVLNERVDIVHAHTAHAVALAAMAVSRTPARMVVTRRAAFRLRSNPLTRWKYHRADAIIAISNRVERALVDGGIDRALIAVVPSGVKLDRHVRAASRAELGVSADAPLVVMVGALTAEKDPVTFVRAVAAASRQVPAMHALLVGDGPLRGIVETEAARLGLASSLRLTGYRDDADALIAAADVVALSSVEEGLGSVLIDAMVFGKPVVATAAGGITELVVDGETGLLVAPGDAEALGAALARVIAEPGMAARLGAAALARAPRFSIENTVARTLAVYERVMSAPAR